MSRNALSRIRSGNGKECRRSEGRPGLVAGWQRRWNSRRRRLGADAQRLRRRLFKLGQRLHGGPLRGREGPEALRAQLTAARDARVVAGGSVRQRRDGPRPLRPGPRPGAGPVATRTLGRVQPVRRRTRLQRRRPPRRQGNALLLPRSTGIQRLPRPLSVNLVKVGGEWRLADNMLLEQQVARVAKLLRERDEGGG